MTEVVSMANGHRTLPVPTSQDNINNHSDHKKAPSDTVEPPSSQGSSRDWLDPSLDKSSDMLRRQLLNAIGGVDEQSSQHQAPVSSPPMLQRADTRPSSSLSPGSGGEDGPGRDTRQKRELNTSKRAAQNRNAQRAFRARKEEYIKSLESKVKDFETIEERNQSLDVENAALRQYIMHLQRRLLDHLGEGEALPEPPVGLNIEGLQITPRPVLPKPVLKGETPNILPAILPAPTASLDKAVPEPVAGHKRARVED